MSNSNHVQHKSMEMKLNSLLTNKFNSLGDKLTNFAIPAVTKDLQPVRWRIISVAEKRVVSR